MAILDDLKGYWQLASASNGVTDLSGVGHDLTMNGSPASVTGAFGNGREFNATGEYYSHANHSDFSASGSDGNHLTAGGWFKFHKGDGASSFWLMAKWDGGEEWALYYDHTVDRFRSIVKRASDNTYHFNSDTASRSNDTWYFIALQIVNNFVTIWVNGVEQDTKFVATAGYTGLSSPLQIGYHLAYPSSGGYVIADECFLFKRALTSDEMLTIYNSGTAITYPLDGSGTEGGGGGPADPLNPMGMMGFFGG